jgi:hypothetical protein
VTATIIDFADYRARKREEPEPRPASALEPITTAEAIAICLDHPETLTVWEQGFLASIRRLSRLSPKQLAVLQRIFDKTCTTAERWP